MGLARPLRLAATVRAQTDHEGRSVLVSELAPMGSMNKVLGDLEEAGHPVVDAVLLRVAMQVRRADAGALR